MKIYKTIELSYFKNEDIYMYDYSERKEYIFYNKNVREIINTYNKLGYYVTACDKIHSVDCIIIMTKELE